MTASYWVLQATRDAARLRALLRDYHPVNRGARTRSGDRISAAGAERGCVDARAAIQAEYAGPVVDVVATFDAALAAGDWRPIHRLLDEAWFGVPESTDCWQIEGFREAVDLLDDLPDEAYAIESEDNER